jgi:hypothetical protein
MAMSLVVEDTTAVNTVAAAEARTAPTQKQSDTDTAAVQADRGWGGDLFIQFSP